MAIRKPKAPSGPVDPVTKMADSLVRIKPEKRYGYLRGFAEKRRDWREIISSNNPKMSRAEIERNIEHHMIVERTTSNGTNYNQPGGYGEGSPLYRKVQAERRQFYRVNNLRQR